MSDQYNDYRYFDKSYHFFQKYRDYVEKLTPEQQKKLRQELLAGRWLYMLTGEGLKTLYNYKQTEKYGVNGYRKGKQDRTHMAQYFGSSINLNYESKEVDPFFKSFNLLEGPLQKEDTEPLKQLGRPPKEPKEVIPSVKKEEREKKRIEKQKQIEKEQEQQRRIDFERFVDDMYFSDYYSEMDKLQRLNITRNVTLAQSKLTDFFDRLKSVLEGDPNYVQTYRTMFRDFMANEIQPLIHEELTQPTTIDNEFIVNQPVGSDIFELVTFTKDGRRIQRQHVIPENELWLFLDNEQNFYIPLIYNQ